MIYEASQRTPLVELTPTSCLIRGRYPENISEWSEPVLSTLEECLSSGNSEFEVDVGFIISTVHQKFFSIFLSFSRRVPRAVRQSPLIWRCRPGRHHARSRRGLRGYAACSYNMVRVESSGVGVEVNNHSR